MESIFDEPNPITYNNLVANLVADGNLSTHYLPATPFLPLLIIYFKNRNVLYHSASLTTMKATFI